MENAMRRLLSFCSVFFVLACVCFPAVAQTGGSAGAAQLASLQQEVNAAHSAADNGWLLISSALVLMMTGPGLALFYGGLVRTKNVLATMMQSFAMMAIVTVLWGTIGYSLCFAPGTPYIGGLSYAFLHGVGAAPNPNYAPTVPHLTFMIFQLMFAVITPALITGAFAERIKFSAMVLLMALWSLFVYAPVAHMVWGQGGFLGASLGGRFPALDFAGGTVVHITSGVSALVCALYLGRRIGYPHEPMSPHSVVLTFIGGCLLWVGWFGFNAGSALAAGTLATGAFVATHFAAAAAVLTWTAAEWLRTGKPSVIGALSGAVAGLVTITPAAGFVTPMSALIIGAIAGVFCYTMVTVVKTRFGYDDSLDAFGVHGAGGTIGALLTGVFATRAVNAVFFDANKNPLPVGWLEGNHEQVLYQAIGALIAWGFAVVGTLLILKVVDLAIGLRVAPEHEAQGLDLSQHGEAGYTWHKPDFDAGFGELSPMSFSQSVRMEQSAD
jgi:Amt family ammonium transporter